MREKVREREAAPRRPAPRELSLHYARICCPKRRRELCQRNSLDEWHNLSVYCEVARGRGRNGEAESYDCKKETKCVYSPALLVRRYTTKCSSTRLRFAKQNSNVALCYCHANII